MTDVTINAAAQHFVLRSGDGFSCFGFANAKKHAEHIAHALRRSDLTPSPEDFGAQSGYEKYLAAVKAWAASAQSAKTYFAPGTDPKAAKVLEACRIGRTRVRLVWGDTTTGRSWLDEHDTVGVVGRSCGAMKVPLLVADGEHGGCAILTDCLLAIVEMGSGKTLYRHPAFIEPDVHVQPITADGLGWEVQCDGQLQARFADQGKAHAYAAFMRGLAVEPPLFQEI